MLSNVTHLVAFSTLLQWCQHWKQWSVLPAVTGFGLQLMWCNHRLQPKGSCCVLPQQRASTALPLVSCSQQHVLWKNRLYFYGLVFYCISLLTQITPWWYKGNNRSRVLEDALCCDWGLSIKEEVKDGSTTAVNLTLEKREFLGTISHVQLAERF